MNGVSNCLVRQDGQDPIVTRQTNFWSKLTQKRPGRQAASEKERGVCHLGISSNSHILGGGEGNRPQIKTKEAIFIF